MDSLENARSIRPSRMQRTESRDDESLNEKRDGRVVLLLFFPRIDGFDERHLFRPSVLSSSVRHDFRMKTPFVRHQTGQTFVRVVVLIHFHSNLSLSSSCTYRSSGTQESFHERTLEERRCSHLFFLFFYDGQRNNQENT